MFSHVQLFMTPWTAHARLPCPSPTLRACSNSCALSRWCHPTTSSSVAPFSYCPQSFPASGSFPEIRLSSSGGQSIGASASVLPMNIQDWFPLGWTGWISLLSRGVSRTFSSTQLSWMIERHIIEVASILCMCLLSLFSRVWLFVTPWTTVCHTPLSMGFCSKNTGVGCHSLLQGIFPAQRRNPGLLRNSLLQLLYCLSHREAHKHSMVDHNYL